MILNYSDLIGLADMCIRDSTNIDIYVYDLVESFHLRNSMFFVRPYTHNLNILKIFVS